MKEILVLKNPIDSGKTHIIGKVYDKIQKNLNLSPRPIHLPASFCMFNKIGKDFCMIVELLGKLEE